MMQGKGVVFHLPRPSHLMWRQREALFTVMRALRFCLYLSVAGLPQGARK